MERRMLGTLEVSMVGLGCATMTPFCDQPDRDAATDTRWAKPVLARPPANRSRPRFSRIGEVAIFGGTNARQRPIEYTD